MGREGFEHPLRVMQTADCPPRPRGPSSVVASTACRCVQAAHKCSTVESVTSRALACRGSPHLSAPTAREGAGYVRGYVGDALLTRRQGAHTAPCLAPDLARGYGRTSVSARRVQWPRYPGLDRTAGASWAHKRTPTTRGDGKPRTAPSLPISAPWKDHKTLSDVRARAPIERLSSSTP